MREYFLFISRRPILYGTIVDLWSTFIIRLVFIHVFITLLLVHANCFIASLCTQFFPQSQLNCSIKRYTFPVFSTVHLYQELIQYRSYAFIRITGHKNNAINQKNNSKMFSLKII